MRYNIQPISLRDIDTIHAFDGLLIDADYPAQALDKALTLLESKGYMCTFVNCYGFRCIDVILDGKHIIVDVYRLFDSDEYI